MPNDGNAGGDVVSGDKIVTQTAGGDIVGGHKVTQSGAGNIFTGSGDVLVIQPQFSPAGARERANLRLLLSKVRTFWIEGVLERSVHNASLLELGLELRAEAVDHPWASVLELPDSTRRALPAGTPVGQVFEQAGRALLILGEPGAGKTFSLLELARDLIARAEADPETVQPIPVVFNLSSWHEQRQPLGAWLASELASKYQIPSRLGRDWLNDQRLLPMLDGLDEVAPAWQAACVRAINQYTAAQGLPGLVVCSRLEEYTRLPVRLRLNAAVCLSPLGREQVGAYLEAGGARLATLRAVMAGDEVLAEMARTPLLLSVMRLAYQDLPPEALAGAALGRVEERRRHLFGQYVAGMLKRKGHGRNRFSDLALMKWLTWLARQMSGHNQTVYLVERMQPSWLSGHAARWAYAVTSRVSEWWLLGLSLGTFLVLTALTFVLTDSVFAANLAAGLSGIDLFDFLQIIMATALWFAGMGLIAGLLCGARFEIGARLPDAKGYLTRAANLVTASVIPPLVMIPLWLWRLAPDGASSMAGILLLGALCLPVVGLSAIAFRAWDSGHSPQSDIPVTDVLHWSWAQSIPGAIAGLIGGATIGSCCMLALALASDSPNVLIRLILGALPMGILGAVSVGLIAGLRTRAIAGTAESGPWLARHARNVLAACLVAGLTMGLFGTLCVAVYSVTLSPSGENLATLSLGFGIGGAIISGAVAALYYGGVTLMRHLVLRLLLIAQRKSPWNLAQIANQAEDVVILRRVGGGYIFIHRLVLDYFAGLPES